MQAVGTEPNEYQSFPSRVSSWTVSAALAVCTWTMFDAHLDEDTLLILIKALGIGAFLDQDKKQSGFSS